jgi:FMN-dependent NADH-azoreductase
MRNILHITASPGGAQSESYRLSGSIVSRLLQRHPEARLVARELWADGMAHVDQEYAAALTGAAAAAPTAQGRGLARSDALIAELEQADAIVIGTPMHNFTVPSTLKAWLDHVVRAHRTFRITPQGKVGQLADRPVYLALTSGSYRVGERARQPDFLEPYLKAILSVVGLRNVTVFSMDGLARGAQAVAEARERALHAMQRHFGT